MDKDKDKDKDNSETTTPTTTTMTFLFTSVHRRRWKPPHRIRPTVAAIKYINNKCKTS
jgi:hypothetical protein